MKSYKKGLRREIDGIKLKPKEETLASAGVEKSSEPIRFRTARRIPIIIAAVLLMSLCAMLTLAEEGNIITQAQRLFSPEDESEESAASIEPKPQAVIQKSKTRTEEFYVLLDYRHDPADRSKDEHFYYRSVKDAVADMGESLYYPDYDTNYASIMYSIRGSGKDAYSTFQIGYYDDALHMFWIHEGVGHFGSAAPDDEAYVSNGNTFYISEFNDGNSDEYLSWGVIDGNTYQLQTDTAENARMIIDSLTAAE